MGNRDAPASSSPPRPANYLADLHERRAPPPPAAADRAREKQPRSRPAPTQWVLARGPRAGWGEGKGGPGCGVGGGAPPPGAFPAGGKAGSWSGKFQAGGRVSLAVASAALPHGPAVPLLTRPGSPERGSWAAQVACPAVPGLEGSGAPTVCLVQQPRGSAGRAQRSFRASRPHLALTGRAAPEREAALWWGLRRAPAARRPSAPV